MTALLEAETPPDLMDTGTQMKREDPMEAKRKHIIYKEEFRRQAVEMVIHSGKTQAQVARELGCSEYSLTLWKKAYLSQQAPAQIEATDGIEDLALAQHHELATNLLDWTTERFANAVFCDSAFEINRRSGRWRQLHTAAVFDHPSDFSEVLPYSSSRSTGRLQFIEQVLELLRIQRDHCGSRT